MNNHFEVTVDFSGGLDLVFDGKTEIKLEIPDGSTIQTVIQILFDKYANHKK